MRGSPCSGFSRCRVQAPGHVGAAVFSSRALQAPQPRHRGLAAPRHYGLFSEQGSNPRILRWPMHSLPLSHEGSPLAVFQPSQFSFSSTALGELTLYDATPLKCVEACFLGQHMDCSAKTSVCTMKRMYFLQLSDVMFQCQLSQIS